MSIPINKNTRLLVAFLLVCAAFRPSRASAAEALHYIINWNSGKALLGEK